MFIGLAGSPSEIDTRDLALKDVTAVGAVRVARSGADDPGVRRGEVDSRPLVAATIGLDRIGPFLAGEPVAGAGSGPKIQVDPQLM